MYKKTNKTTTKIHIHKNSNNVVLSDIEIKKIILYGNMADSDTFVL